MSRAARLRAVLLAKALLPVAVLAGGHAHAQSGVTALPGFHVAAFGQVPAGLSHPDSLAIVGRSLWVGYGNTAAPDGSSGSSNVVEYGPSGSVLRNIRLRGHNDGLRLTSSTR